MQFFHFLLHTTFKKRVKNTVGVLWRPSFATAAESVFTSSETGGFHLIPPPDGTSFFPRLRWWWHMRAWSEVTAAATKRSLRFKTKEVEWVGDSFSVVAVATDENCCFISSLKYLTEETSFSEAHSPMSFRTHFYHFIVVCSHQTSK